MFAKNSSLGLLLQLVNTVECFTRKVLIFFILYVGTALAAPVVSNLTVSQRAGTKLVDINYDLTLSGTGSLAVYLDVSSDGGLTWGVPVKTVNGDIGLSVNPGLGRSIVWDAGADWPRNYSSQMHFRIRLDDDFP